MLWFQLKKEATAQSYQQSLPVAMAPVRWRAVLDQPLSVPMKKVALLKKAPPVFKQALLLPSNESWKEEKNQNGGRKRMN